MAKQSLSVLEYLRMIAQLPHRIANYKVSAASPTAELLTLGQIFAEVGDHNASFCDGEHLSVARKCANRLNKVSAELLSRGAISSEDDFYAMPTDNLASANLSELTVDELYKLYRQWPLRHKARKDTDREPDTFFFEGRIVRELQQRTPATKADRLKFDYCILTYRNEIELLALQNNTYSNEG